MSEYQKFLSYINSIGIYKRIWRRLDYDRQCNTPTEGLTLCGRDAAFISRMLEEAKKEPAFINNMHGLLTSGAELTDIQRAAVSFQYSQYERDANITPEMAQKFSEVTGNAFDAWIRAREENRFDVFAPYLADVISMTRKMAYLRKTDVKSVYDLCLDNFERNISNDRLCEFFDQVREKLCQPSVMSHSDADEDHLFEQSFPLDKQKAFSIFLLNAEGLPEDKITLREAEHPFTQFFNFCDVRITTHYYENDVLSNLYTVLHEGGHAILHLYLPTEYYENGLSEAPTYGMHECISRFYENIIGRSMAFCQYITPVMQEYFPKQCVDLTPECLYRYVNRRSHTPIRMEADEWSYCAHILVRYELEKAFMENDLSVEELSRVWNEKYKQYLNMEIRDDNNGVLQDVHWVDSIGYFPSYALGTVGGAQLFSRMNQDFDVYESVRAGRMDCIRDWLKSYAFPKTISENYFTWIEEITGRPLSVDDYAAYLNSKSNI